MDSIPYYHQSVDWERLFRDHPPPPMYATTIGAMSDDEIFAHQNALFRDRVADAWKVEFFADLWGGEGIEEGDIRSLDDLPMLPVYNSDDLKLAIDRRPPFGTHQPLGRKEFGSVPLKIQTSGGTTGLPRVTLFDPIAWEVQAIQGARAMYSQGMRPGDVAQIPRTCALGNAAWLEYKACHDWLGVVPVTTGSGVVTSTERQLEYARAFGVNAWIANAEYLGRIVEVASDIGFDLPSLGTKMVHSYLGNDPAGGRRAALEEAFQAPVYDAYGTHEVGEIAAECVHKTTLHVHDDTVVLESMSLADGSLLPRGHRGSLIATSLHRSYPPIIRYDLRDIMTVSPRATCACGVRSTGLSNFQGRADEMVKVRGQNVFPRAVEAVIFDDPRCNGQYLCVAESRGTGVVKMTEMSVRVERQGSAVDPIELQADLSEILKRVLGVGVRVSIEEPGALSEITGYDGREGKVKRLLDLREVQAP